MPDNFKLTGDNKIKILFAILFVFNILLYINLFTHHSVLNEIDIDILHNMGTILAAIIILSFISTRLPKFKEYTAGSVYEIVYLLIFGLLSITVSFFNKSTNGESIWGPFLEMFRILSVILILTFLASKSKSFRLTAKGKISWKTQAWQLFVFSILGIVASYFTLDVNGAPANARGLLVVISAFFAGPYVGVPVGIISGLWRYTLGGPTALSCAISTILAGLLGSLVYRWNGNKFPSMSRSAIFMFLFSGFDMFLVTVLTANGKGLLIANALYGPMTFSAVLGIMIFKMFLTEKNDEENAQDSLESDETKPSASDEFNEIKIKEISKELNEYKDKVDKLEKEVNKLKKD